MKIITESKLRAFEESLYLNEKSRATITKIACGPLCGAAPNGRDRDGSRRECFGTPMPSGLCRREPPQI